MIVLKAAQANLLEALQSVAGIVEQVGLRSFQNNHESSSL